MELEELLHSGMNRVASIITTNPSYDAILGKRLQTPAYQALTSDEQGTLVDKEQVIQHFASRCKNARPSYHELSQEGKSARHLAFASTQNNRRELSNLLDWLTKYRIKADIVNIADCQRERSTKISPIVTEATIDAFTRFIRSEKEMTKGLLHQLVAYSSFVQGANLTLSRSSGEAFVVANDHSPGPVAYERMARYMGMSTIYLQHAEVTESFPPLDFDLSILRNISSRITYDKAGKSRGESLVLPREQRVLRIDNLLATREELYRTNPRPAVIYPSGVSSVEAISRLARNLRCNDEVSSVAVKLHPADKNTSRFHEVGLSTLDRTPEEPHTAICGNSSVVIELIGKGNLVYQCFELDTIPSDYYGFVADGLAREISIASSGEPFVSSNHIEIDIEKYARVDPSVESVQNVAEGVKAYRLLQTVFGTKRWSPRGVLALYQRESLLRDLYCFTHAAILLSRSGVKAYGEDSKILAMLDEAFASRDVRLIALFKDIGIDDAGSVLEYWLVTKAIEWNGKTPSAANLKRLSDFVRCYSGEKSVRAWLEAKNLDLLLRYGTGSDVLEFFHFSKIVTPRNLSSNRKVAIDRFIRLMSGRKDELRRLMVPAFDSLTPLESLKLSVQNKHDVDGHLEFMDYRSVEHAFMEAQPALASEYRELVQKSYWELGGRTIYIDVERNPVQRTMVLDEVESHLQERKGYSFIRLSDGEGFIFQDESSPFSLRDSLNRQRHWWGEEIDQNILSKLRQDLQIGVLNANLIGIPSVYRFLRDHSDRSKSLLGTIQGRGLISVLLAMSAYDTPNKRYTDDKANIALFRDRKSIARLAESAGKVIVISSASADAANEAFAFAEEFAHISVPTHYKTVGNSKYQRSEKPLPYVYADVRDQLSAIVEPGDLVLVGAGVAGKVFVACAKRHRAVGLDIGSSMDQMLDARIESLH